MRLTSTKKSKLDGVKVLVYGKSGVGKTRLCATAPKPLILSAEAGLLSLRDYDLPVITIKTYDDLLEAYDWVKKTKKQKKYETICLDSISEIADIVLTGSKLGKRDNRQAYGAMLDDMMHVIKKFRDLRGLNVYFSARRNKFIDSTDNTVTYGPDMPGSKLGQWLPYYFDEVFHLYRTTKKKKEIYYLRTHENEQYEAKDRSGSLKAREVANLSKIFNKIKGV